MALYTTSRSVICNMFVVAEMRKVRLLHPLVTVTALETFHHCSFPLGLHCITSRTNLGRTTLHIRWTQDSIHLFSIIDLFHVHEDFFQNTFEQSIALTLPVNLLSSYFAASSSSSPFGQRFQYISA